MSYINRVTLIADMETLYLKGKCTLRELIDNQPAADVRDNVRGEWKEENRRPKSSMFCCSLCHRTAYDPQPSRAKNWEKHCRYNFCPNCGADMRIGGRDDV